MIEWLQKTGGYTSNGLTYEEKRELEQLRIDIGVYRDREEADKKKLGYEEIEERHSSSEEDVFMNYIRIVRKKLI